MLPRIVHTSVLVGLVAVAVLGVTPTSSAGLDIVQVGVTLHGSADDEFGSAIALSSDGSVLAVGSPKPSASPAAAGSVSVFVDTDGVWENLGASGLVGDEPSDMFGTSVALSATGHTVAVGAPTDSSLGSAAGQVSVFGFDASTNQWTPLGGVLNGTGPNQQFGFSVALDDTGTVLAVGAKSETSPNGALSGTVGVYSLVGSTWTPLGARLDGQVARDGFGTSVSLSATGQTLAVGAPGHDTGGDNSGRVVVYSYDAGSTSWTPLGGVLDGAVANEASGSAVALSATGTTVVIGSPGYGDSDVGAAAGAVRSYALIDNIWTARGAALLGARASDARGTAVAVSDTGARVVAGGRNGPVVVYDYVSDILTQTTTPFAGFTLGEGAGTAVALGAGGNRVAVGAPRSNLVADNAGSVSVFGWPGSREPAPDGSPPGLAGIHLHHTGPVGRSVDGSPVYLGASQVMPGSRVVLRLAAERVNPVPATLTTLVTNGHGTVHARHVLSALTPGDYTLTLSGVHASGTGLILTHRFSVGPNGHITHLGDNVPGIW